MESESKLLSRDQPAIKPLLSLYKASACATVLHLSTVCELWSSSSCSTSRSRNSANMRLLFCVFIVSAPLVLCEEDWYWTTRYPYTTVGPGVNLKGKMVTLSQYSGVTFRRPYYQSAPGEGAASTTSPEWTTEQTTEWTTERTTEWSSEWTTRYYTTTPPPPTRGVTVCLRFLTDLNGLDLFKLSPRSPLTVSWRNPSTYTLSWNYYSSVTLRVMISLWSSVRTQPWTSVCVVLDSFKNIVQVFQGGSMSIRKIPPSRLVWSGEPVVDVSGLDGQVTDLEVWDYPLGYAEVFSYMQNYGSGTVLTWSNIAYSNRGRILIEESYALRQMKPLNHSERQEQPIRRGRGRSLRLKYRKMWKGKKQRNQMV